MYGRLKADIREKRYFPEKYAQPKDITLRVWVNLCLEGFTNLKGYRNQKQYGKWWNLVLGKRLLNEVTTEEIARVQAKAIKEGDRTPQTMNRYLAFLKHVLNLAVRDGKIDRNAVRGVKFSPEPKGKLRFLSETEISQLKEAMSPNEWAIVQFALETGLRQSEQFKSRWDWVNREQGIMTIPHSKSGRTRHIPLSEGALHLLESSRSWVDSSYVFPSPIQSRNPRSGDDFSRRVFGGYLKKTGIEGVTWHTLRHTFASRLVMAGVDIRTVQELMGHSTIVMTMRYAHLSPDHLRNAVNKVTLRKKQSGTVTRTVTKEKQAMGFEKSISSK